MVQAVSRGPNSNEGMDKHALLQRTQQEIADLGSRLSDLSKSGDTKQIDQIRRRLEEKVRFMKMVVAVFFIPLFL